MPNLQVNRKLEPFLTKSKPIKVAIGGRGSGKSIGFGDMLTMKMETERADIYCLREYQDSLSDSVHRVFKDSVQKRLQLTGWDIQENRVIAPSGAVTTYKGASRNPDSIQSAQGYKYSWFEEAHRASQESLDKLLPTILRNPGAECWFSANPQSANDPFSQRFIVPYLDALERDGYYEDEIQIIIVVNWRDNPWWNQEQEKLRKWDYENLPRAKYDWIWEGKFNDHVENSIIKAEWFDAAVDAHKVLNFKPRGQKVLAHDPSDSGDAKAYVLRHGNIILAADENTKDDVNDGCDWALDKAQVENVDVFRWDYGGLGISLKRQVHDSLVDTRIAWDMFNGAETPEDAKSAYEPVDGGTSYQNKKNDDVFRNKRAQCYWRLRDRFYLTYRAVVLNDREIPVDKLISISSDILCIQKLRSEICRIPLKNSGTGLIQIMDKAEMKSKLKIESPNLADSLMMTEANPMKLIRDNFLEPLNYNHRAIV